MTETIDARPVPTPELVDLPPRDAAVVRIEGSLTELPRLLGEAFGLVEAAVAASDASLAGPPFARYLAVGDTVTADVGFPYVGTLAETDRVRRVELPRGRAVRTVHVGPYDQVAATWERATTWIGEQGLESSGPGWESYLTGPDEPGPPVTEVYLPVR